MTLQSRKKPATPFFPLCVQRTLDTTEAMGVLRRQGMKDWAPMSSIIYHLALQALSPILLSYISFTPHWFQWSYFCFTQAGVRRESDFHGQILNCCKALKSMELHQLIPAEDLAHKITRRRLLNWLTHVRENKSLSGKWPYHKLFCFINTEHLNVFMFILNIITSLFFSLRLSAVTGSLCSL